MFRNGSSKLGEQLFLEILIVLTLLVELVIFQLSDHIYGAVEILCFPQDTVEHRGRHDGALGIHSYGLCKHTWRKLLTGLTKLARLDVFHSIRTPFLEFTKLRLVCRRQWTIALGQLAAWVYFGSKLPARVHDDFKTYDARITRPVADCDRSQKVLEIVHLPPHALVRRIGIVRVDYVPLAVTHAAGPHMGFQTRVFRGHDIHDRARQIIPLFYSQKVRQRYAECPFPIGVKLAIHKDRRLPLWLFELIVPAVEIQHAKVRALAETQMGQKRREFLCRKRTDRTLGLTQPRAAPLDVLRQERIELRLWKQLPWASNSTYIIVQKLPEINSTRLADTTLVRARNRDVGHEKLLVLFAKVSINALKFLPKNLQAVI